MGVEATRRLSTYNSGDTADAGTADLGAQGALMNPGGLRTDLEYASSGGVDPDGNVTDREVGGRPTKRRRRTRHRPGRLPVHRGCDEQGWQDVDFLRPDDVPGGPLTLTVVGPGGTAVPFVVPVAKTVDPVATWVLGWPDRSLARGDLPVEFTALVRAAESSAPLGEAQVYDGWQFFGSVWLNAEDEGRAVVELSALGRGLHTLRVEFDGSATHLPSSSPTIPIFVR